MRREGDKGRAEQRGEEKEEEEEEEEASDSSVDSSVGSLLGHYLQIEQMFFTELSCSSCSTVDNKRAFHSYSNHL